MMSNYDRFLFLNRSDGFVEDEYEVSEKMSTYLVCIIICDFVARNGTTKNNIQVQLYSSNMYFIDGITLILIGWKI